MSEHNDTARVSDGMDALERTTPIVQVAEGVATTTSMRVASGTQNDHSSVLRLIRDNLADFEEFGLVGFEIRPRPKGQHGGGDVQIAILNEDHATLLLTYMRNNAIVKDFKKRLVREFSALRRGVSAQTREERLALAVVEAGQMLAEKDEQIAILAPKAEFYDDLMQADGTYKYLAVAKILGWGRTTMLAELRRLGVLQSNNLPYRRYEHHFKVVPQTYVNKRTGETVPTATAYVRPSGIDFLRKKLTQSKELVSQ